MLPWASVFSENVSTTLQTIESWISSIFFFLFLITVGPWFVFLAYDVILYVFRTITYEIPIVGGRARGKERPRAPSLKERATGDPRVMGIGVPAATYVEQEDIEEERQLTSGEATPDEGEKEATQATADEDGDGLINTAQGEKHSAPEGSGFTQEQFETDEDDRPQAQRIFSIGGTEERENWTEVNARRRMGFKDDESPG